MGIWHWPENQRSNYLLRDIIFKLYLGKEYASGFPPNVNTPEEKEVSVLLALQLFKVTPELTLCGEFQAYTKKVSEQLGGIEVDPDLFEFNPGLRAVKKFMLNNICKYLSILLFFNNREHFRGILGQTRRQHCDRVAREA